MKFIIDFEVDVTEGQVAEFCSEHSLTIVQTFNNFDNVYLVEGDTAPPVTDIVTSVINDDSEVLQLLVDVVDDSPEIQLDPNADADWWKIYSLIKTDLEADHVPVRVKGNPSNVYLLDSGIDATHPEFADTQIVNLYSVTADDFTDSTGHGTALASLIAGSTCAISNPTLKIVKVISQSGEIKQSILLAALDAIISDVVANPGKISVANMSWAIAKNAYIEQKINAMIDRGVSVVAAAGNSGMPIVDVTPASMLRVLTIGSYNQEFVPSDFSNYTDPSAVSYTSGDVNYGELDCWAPGEKIRIAIPGGGYGFAAGTSLSAAIHSGATAYNAAVFADANGDIYACIDDIVGRLSTLSTSRRGMLTLAEKYQSSQNLLTTFRNTVFDDNFAPKEQHIARMIDGVASCSLLFDPRWLTSYEILTPLPDWLTFHNGVISGVPVMTTTDEYEVTTLTVNVSLTDGRSFDQEVTVFVSKPNFDYQELETSDDPTLAMVALVRCGGTECGNGCTMYTACANCEGNPKIVNCGCYEDVSMC